MSRQAEWPASRYSQYVYTIRWPSVKINDLAKKIGLTAPTIRFYEQEGLLDTRHVRRGENNYRDYGGRQLSIF